jgi:hypothetical protein
MLAQSDQCSACVSRDPVHMCVISAALGLSELEPSQAVDDEPEELAVSCEGIG